MADPPREGDEASRMGSAKDGPSEPEADAPRAPGAENARERLEDAPRTPGGNARERLEGRFEQALSAFRVVVIVPVIILLLAALSSFAYGTDVFVRSVANVVEDPELTTHNLGYLLLLTDLFLVGATLMIAAFGLYSLFITGTETGGLALRLPHWLRMHDLNDLKARVISMIILVAGVAFVDVAVESKDDLGTLYLGGAVALVIAALTAFLHFGRMDSGNGS